MKKYISFENNIFVIGKKKPAYKSHLSKQNVQKIAVDT